MTCELCGKPGSGSYCNHCGGAMVAAMSGNALTWPFCRHGWAISLWMPMLGSIPFFNILAFGWSLDAVRRRALDDPEPLPQPEEITSILAKGFVVFIFWLGLFIVPLIILTWLTSVSWIPMIWEMLVEAWKAIRHEPHENLFSLLLRNLFTFFSDATAPLVFISIASPLFLVSRLRYAVTGRASSFFCLFANISFCVRYIGDVLLYYLLSTLLRSALVFLAVLLIAVPVIGQLLPFVLGGAGVWIRSFWAGNIAHKMQLEVAQRRKVTPLQAHPSSSI